MIERIYTLEDIDLQTFVGANRSNLITLQSLFPKTRLRIHQNVLKVLGEETSVEELFTVLSRLEQLCAQHNQLTEATIIEAVRQYRSSGSFATPASSSAEALIYGVHGKAIQPRGKNQARLVKAFSSRDLCFAVGPAGSGKTFLAICLAVKALKSKQVRRIILSRPAVEAGEKLGFLPGEMKDKLDPYLQPLYDALGELIPAPKLKDLIDTGVIQIAPLAFMRGRTLSDAVVILDEAQNTTPQQMKMFLTRLGMNSKMIVTGDLTQVDLPRGVTSGLRDAVEKLHHLPSIGFIHFDKVDIVRHPLVAQIIDVYDQRDKDEDPQQDN